MKEIIAYDQQLFVFLNNLGSTTYDGFWLFLTKQTHWTPFFLVLLLVIYKKIGWKQTLFLLVFMAALITFTDQFTNLVKNNVQRLRPCNTPNLQGLIRIVKASDTFSFFSGHAANSMASATFLYAVFHKQMSWFKWLFLWPLVFAYSRIYLGLHFPLDILAGFAIGSCIGYAFSRLYVNAEKRSFFGFIFRS
ncbi:MAG: phosphatase PAP2 family protein [Flavobacterium sp.]|nr:phosphatase PAP2 family protein [Flavobacterium sp.]